jgi:PE-PPE domain/PE family
MSFVTTAPQMLADAAGNLTNIGSMVEEATTLASFPTTAVAPAGADEVSMMISALFESHGQQFQALAAQGSAFHAQFAQLMGSAGSAYQEAEAAATQLVGSGGAVAGVTGGPLQSLGALATPLQSLGSPLLGSLSNGAPAITGTNPVGTALQPLWTAAEQPVWNGITAIEQPFVPALTQVLGPFGFGSALNGSSMQLLPNVMNSSVSLLVGGTTYPVLGGIFPGLIHGEYYPNLPLGNIGSVFTPEQLFPLTPNLGSLTLGQSISQGVPLLNSAIMQELGQGNNVSVWTTSQSSIVATEEIRNLMAMGSPDTSKLSFILTGNPNNPNGGIFERFTGAYIPGLDAYFNGATPPNSPYMTQIFTNQYDAVGDFPQYPLNVVSDLNAVAGFAIGGDHNYTFPFNYVQLPTSPGYTGDTSYYFALEQDVPLLAPLRIAGTDLGSYIPQAPMLGNATADLLQPDLRVIVDQGYGSNEYANIPTPGSLFVIPNPTTILPDLATGLVQGPQGALHDLGFPVAAPTGYPATPVLNPDLNFDLPQSSVTGLSVLTGAEGDLANAVGLIPPWDM